MTAEGDGEEWWSTVAHAAAVEARTQAQILEPAITPVVQDALQTQGTTLTRLDDRIKPEGSLAAKILRDREPSDADAESIARRINDVLRYTTVLPDQNYWNVGTLICQALVDAGYSHIAPRLGWNAVGYKGRNERFAAPSGQRFELQIHTSDSLHACDETRGWYEEQRLPTTSQEREWELQALINREFVRVPIPPGTPII